jgi:hypothetical protein
VRSSFLVGNQHSFVYTSIIDGLNDPTERIEPPLAPLTLIEEVPDSLFDQFVATLIPSPGRVLARPACSNRLVA